MSNPYDPRALPDYGRPGHGDGGYPPPPPPPPGGGYVASGGYGFGGYGPQPGQAPSAPVFPPAADYGPRAGAYLIDGFVSLLLFVVAFFGPFALTAWLVTSWGSESTVMITLLIAFPVLLLLASFLNFAYFWIPHARSGQTLGKRMLGLQVIHLETGRPPSLGQSAGRQLITIALGAVTGIGTLLDLLWPLWDEPYRQAVHDKAVSTRVIRVR